MGKTIMSYKHGRRLLAWLACLALGLTALAPAAAEDLEAPVLELSPFAIGLEAVAPEAPDLEAAIPPEDETADADEAGAAEAIRFVEEAGNAAEAAADVIDAPEDAFSGDDGQEIGPDAAPAVDAVETIKAVDAIGTIEAVDADAAESEVEPEAPIVAEADAPEAVDAGPNADVEPEGALVTAEDEAATDAAPEQEGDQEASEALNAADVLLAQRNEKTVLGLNAESLTLGVKETFTLAASLNGEKVNQARFSTSNAKVARVSAAGKVTARKRGTAVITATFGSYRAKCAVKVLKAPGKVTLSDAKRTLCVGERWQLTAKLPAKTASAIKWKSSRTKVAKVSADGMVTAVGTGKATITAVTFNGHKATCRVTVKDAPQSITLSPESCEIGVGEKLTLEPLCDPTGDPELTWKSSKKSVARVSAGGVVTGKKAGTAVVTATTCNGLSARCSVRVRRAPDSVKLSQDELKLSVGEAVRLSAALPAKTASALTWKSSRKAVAEVDAEGLVTAVGVGTAKITVTTFNGRKATCAVTVRKAEDPVASSVCLNVGSTVLMSVGSSRTLKATVTPEGLEDALNWSAESSAVGLVAKAGGACVVTARKAGKTRVTAGIAGGGDAVTTVVAVDLQDPSDDSLALVQKALLSDDRLLENKADSAVVWELIQALLLARGLSESRAGAIVEKVRSADAVYRDLYLYSLGAYNIAGEASRDKHGALLTVSQFSFQDDTVYLTKSSSDDDEAYAYTAIHETGHAIDYNATGEIGLASENDAAVEALRADVRQLLADRADEAVETAGVAVNDVNVDQVVDALLDHRGLLNKDDVMDDLSDAEQEVYGSLSDLVGAEMDAALPMNNGVMVWDAVEGVTNYAVHGKFGHSYMLNYPQYREIANYYYYDKDGTPRISAEPWAEFFSSNIVKDASTVAVNLSYLPRTCKYFAEVFAPKVLDYFKSLVKGK